MIAIDQLIRSKRKTISLEVLPDGKLIVRAPLHLPKSRIDELVTRKTDWFARHKAQICHVPPVPCSERFTDGQKFWFLGHLYRLVLTGRQSPPLIFDNAFYLAQPALDQAEQLLKAWYRLQAVHILKERATLLSAKFRLSYHAVKITSARTCWGSCSPKNDLSFPWRLVMAPIAVIDYVVIHELVHTQERNHQKKFWDKVSALVPDYKEQVKWLKTNSQSLRII